MEQMILVGIRESKAVQRSVLEKLKELSKPVADPMVALNDPEFLRGTLLTYTEKLVRVAGANDPEVLGNNFPQKMGMFR